MDTPDLPYRTTLRLPDRLKLEVMAYSRAVGISFNSLVAVALRSYLDQHPAPPPPPMLSRQVVRQQERAAKKRR